MSSREPGRRNTIAAQRPSDAWMSIIPHILPADPLELLERWGSAGVGISRLPESWHRSAALGLGSTSLPAAGERGQAAAQELCTAAVAVRVGPGWGRPRTEQLWAHRARLLWKGKALAANRGCRAPALRGTCRFKHMHTRRK